MNNLNDFLIFIAPFIVLIISIAVAFGVASSDAPVRKEE